MQKLKDLQCFCHYSICPSAVWQTPCADCARSLQRLHHKQSRSVANGGAKRSSFCLLLELSLDLEMCGDFHICATRTVAVRMCIILSVEYFHSYLHLIKVQYSVSVSCKLFLFVQKVVNKEIYGKLIVYCSILYQGTIIRFFFSFFYSLQLPL